MSYIIQGNIPSNLDAFARLRVRQTFKRFNYQPGKSQLIIRTEILGVSNTGITKRLGLFDGVAPISLSDLYGKW